MAAVSTPLFILNPVGLTFLLGEASVARQKEDRMPRVQRAIAIMSALTHSTHLAGVIIPLVILGVSISSVSVGPAGPLFNTDLVHIKQHNLYHLLDLPGFITTATIGALAVVMITYVIVVCWSSRITHFVMRRIPHEAVLALPITFILLLAHIDTDQKAGLANIFEVLPVGIACRPFNRLGILYGVQFIFLCAAFGIVKVLAALV